MDQPVILTIEKTVRFEAAHHLPKMPPGHKCRRVHGHSYVLTVAVRGFVNHSGIVWDFGDLSFLLQAQIIETFDHQPLNDIIPNPTGENVVLWIVERLEASLPDQVALQWVRLQEGENNATFWERV